MRRLNELDEMRKDLETYIEKTAKQMGDSAICLTLFTDNYKKGLDALIQFAVAMMLDKPIYLLAKKGTDIPKKVRQIADGIEFFTDDDIIEASKRLLNRAMEQGTILSKKAKGKIAE